MVMLCMCYDVGNTLGVVDNVVVEQQVCKFNFNGSGPRNLYFVK